MAFTQGIRKVARASASSVIAIDKGVPAVIVAFSVRKNRAYR